MLFAELSPMAEWAVLIGAITGLVSVVLSFIAAVFSIWAKSRADAAGTLVVTTTEEAKVERAHVAEKALVAATEVKQEVAKVAEKSLQSAELAKEAAATVTGIAAKQEDQHRLMNGGLTELKNVIAAAKMAEGVLLGRAQLQAEIDAKAAAIAEGVKLATQQPAVAAPAQEPMSVMVVSPDPKTKPK